MPNSSVPTASDVSSSDEEMETLISTFITVFYLLNLAIFALQLPLSLLNIGILCRTSLLHPNLKFVLFVQSVLFTVFALARSAQTIAIFASASTDQHPQIGYKIVLFLVDYPQLCITYVGHILFIERTFGIVFFKRYQQANNPIFSCVWFFILNAYAFVIVAEQSFKDEPQMIITSGLLISNYTTLGICFAEIVAFSFMSSLNLKFFTSTQQRGYSLNERYQLAENIRTGRQLWPTFLLHFLNICAYLVPSVLGFYQFLTDIKLLTLIWMSYFLFLTISNAVIEFTTISLHPILRRDALRIVANIFAAFSLPMPFAQRVDGGTVPAQNIERIDGKTLHKAKLNEMDNYFQLLTAQWQ